jgi:hypothetical protein
VGLEFPIRGIPIHVDRLTFLEELVRGKRVIDLGCADHLDQLEPKLRAGTWLHARLSASATRCIGIDIDETAVAQVSAAGFDVLVGDITGPGMPEISDADWDFLVLGEILEHVDDPVSFLRSIRERYGARLPQVVMTVPNAFSLQSARAALGGVELINSDHRYAFTPYTLAKVATRAGYEPVWFGFADRDPLSPPRGVVGRFRRSIRTPVLRRWPHLHVDLVMLPRVP